MKYFQIIVIILTMLNLIFSKKEIDIKEDFTAEIDYRLEKTNSNWRKRGVINFLQKNNNKNYKSSVNILNEQLSNDQIEEIYSECKSGNGLYFIRIKIQNNLYFSQINSCYLVNNKLCDRFIINHFGSVKSDQLLSISYDVDLKQILNEINTENKVFTSSVEFIDNLQSLGPIFPEEKEINKNGPQNEQPSFFSKYWWVIMIIVFMMMIKGPAAEEGSSS